MAYTHEMRHVCGGLDHPVQLQESLVVELILSAEHETGSHVNSPIGRARGTCRGGVSQFLASAGDELTHSGLHFRKNLLVSGRWRQL